MYLQTTTTAVVGPGSWGGHDCCAEGVEGKKKVVRTATIRW